MPSWPSSIVVSPLLPQPVNVNPSSSPRTLLRKATMKLKVGILAALALTLASTAAAGTPIRWTPTRMAAALTVLKYPSSALEVWTTTCKGASTARRGTYTAFRCTITYYGHTTKTVWAKPLTAGRVCASTSSLKACRPLAAGPLAGDPAVCSVNRPDDCAQAAAKAAISKKHGPQVNLACTQAGTIYKWSCTSTAGSYEVAFTKGATTWITSVTP